MNLFDQLVTEALEHQPQLASLRVVVEKELLHHDILRILEDNGILTNLTFIGGTCLRLCYGGLRLSEDLDFTGGINFSRKELAHMSKVLAQDLQEKYNLKVEVSEPIKDKLNVNTWKIKIETRPETKHIPAQRINIDICAITSYERVPTLPLNHYGIDTGTKGLIIQSQSREEIYTDKLIAFAYRPNRIKHRDLWDIFWLHQQGIKPRLTLIPDKLKERHHTMGHFLDLFNQRRQAMIKNPEIALEFKDEMRRFLPSNEMTLVENEAFWTILSNLLDDLGEQIKNLYT